MTFKSFITRQRSAIFFIGIILFAISILVAHSFQYTSLWGGLFTNLAASSITIVFTALVIDYIGAREEAHKIKDALSMAEEEIQAICHRIEWQIAQLFGLERDRDGRQRISSHEEARKYIARNNKRAQTFLSTLDFESNTMFLDREKLQRFTERLQSLQSQLEQTLVLYEYALSHDFRVHVFSLRRELQVSERLISFIDFDEELPAESESLVRRSLKVIHTAAVAVIDATP